MMSVPFLTLVSKLLQRRDVALPHGIKNVAVFVKHFVAIPLQ
jgi:hypothetical protein